MQNLSIESLGDPKAWLAMHLPEAAVGLIPALLTLIVVVVFYRITRRHHRRERRCNTRRVT